MIDRPAYQSSPAFTQHLGRGRPYLRDTILGTNDGLVSMLLLVAGVVGGGMSTRNVLLTAIAGAVAGAISMAAGEYMATKSQDEVFQGELKLERDHIRDHREAELHELQDLLGAVGLHGDLQQQVVDHFGRDDESLLHVMTSLEFGVIETQRRRPQISMLVTFVTFIFGSLPSVLPFAFLSNTRTGLMVAAAFTVLGLLAVGAIKTRATHGNPLKAAVENLLITALGSAAAYGIGTLFDRLVGGS